MGKHNSNFLKQKKYRTILISVALFLTFDIGVLIPNIIISSKLKRDAIGINLAGRQRMLSQRTVKALFKIYIEQCNGGKFTSIQQELALAYRLFDETLEGFNSSGIVTGGNGEPVFLPAVESESAKRFVRQAMEIWLPYKEKLNPILAAEKSVDAERLDEAIAYASEHNLQLLDLMNGLTYELEQIANRKASYLQRIQLGGLILALLNFFILLSHTLRKLTIADSQLADANSEILALNDRLEAENLRLSAEVEITRQLQQMILPKPEELRQITELDIAGFMEPAAEVGGDYYDVLQHEGRVKIGIGDVTGHGLESGVLMIMVQTAVRSLMENNETDPAKFFNALNRTIYDNVQRMESDKNLTLMLLDYHEGVLSFSGQHEHIIVVRPHLTDQISDPLVEQIDTIDLGFPIGLEEDISDFVSSTRVHLNPGDIVVLYTDGITEAENLNKLQYGLERLCDVVKHNWQKTAEGIRQSVINDLRQHIGSQKVYDDITLLVIKRRYIENARESLQFGKVGASPRSY